MQSQGITVVKNTQNTFNVALSIDGDLIDHTLITGAQLRTSDGVILSDSATHTTNWDFTNKNYIAITLGTITALAAGNYRCTLIARDSANPQGVAWQNLINILVLP